MRYQLNLCKRKQVHTFFCFVFIILLSNILLAQPGHQYWQQPGLTVFLGMPDKKILSSFPEKQPGLIQILVKRNNNPIEISMRQNDDWLSDGKISIMDFNGKVLPYCDNSVNTLIITGKTKVTQKELMRVLVPRGVLVNSDGVTKTKTVTKNIDEWTHTLYDAHNNAVSKDIEVGPPKRIRWIGSPDHLRHHNLLASFSAMVTTKGRLFTIMDKGTLVTPYLPSNWVLNARDAFNGITLWEIPIKKWAPTMRQFRAGPAELARRLVAVGDEVFITPGLEAPVSILNAVTGKLKTVLPGTEGTEEILVLADTILVVTGNPEANEFIDWASRERDFTTAPRHKRAIVAIRRKTHKILWKKQDEQTMTLLPISLTADKERVFFINDKGVNALNIKNGKPLWQTKEPVSMQRRAKFALTIVVYKDVLFYSDRLPEQKDADKFYKSRPKKYQERYISLSAFPSRLRAYNVKTGKRLWECSAGESFHTPTDIFVVNDIVWYTTSPAMLEGNYKDGRDYRTGKIVRTIKNAPDINHGRCYRNRSTVRYLFGGKNGIDFIDPTGKENRYVPEGLRGTCQLGYVPANGLLYLPPHACTCDSEKKMNGFMALAKDTGESYPDPMSYQPRLYRGPVFKKAKFKSNKKTDEDWPTFRHDPARTGKASTYIPDKLKIIWKKKIGRRPTASVCVNGTLYVAARDDHVLWAIDANTGIPRWQYRTSGRIDSPPTVESGLVLFGCRDGWLRCLSAKDGALVWRFRGAPEERQIVVREQLESIWPLHGATLVKDGKVYFSSGRASILDGGITVYCVELFTGKLVNKIRLSSDNPQKTVNNIKNNKKGKIKNLSDSLLDVMSADSNNIYMRHVALNKDLKIAKASDHLVTATGFLDDNFFHRSYWGYSDKVKRYKTGTQKPAGFIMTIDGDTAYSYARKPEYYIGHIKGFERHLCAMDLEPKQSRLKKTQPGKNKKSEFVSLIKKFMNKGIEFQWSEDSPILVKGMTVAQDKLIVAGPVFNINPSAFLVNEATDEIRINSDPDKENSAEASIMKSHKGLKGEIPPLLCIYDKKTGKIKNKIELDSIPVFDGLIAADGHLYISCEDGTVICLGR